MSAIHCSRYGGQPCPAPLSRVLSLPRSSRSHGRAAVCIVCWTSLRCIVFWRRSPGRRDVPPSACWAACRASRRPTFSRRLCLRVGSLGRGHEQALPGPLPHRRRAAAELRQARKLVGARMVPAGVRLPVPQVRQDQLTLEPLLLGVGRLAPPAQRPRPPQLLSCCRAPPLCVASVAPLVRGVVAARRGRPEPRLRRRHLAAGLRLTARSGRLAASLGVPRFVGFSTVVSTVAG